MTKGGRDQRAPMERIIGFMALLHDARTRGRAGVPATELLASAGWEDAGDGITALNRDLKALRTLGWRIENVSAKGLPAVFRMTSVDNRLKLRLTPGQQAALRRAVLLADRADLADQLDLPEDAAPAPLAASVTADDAPELTAVVAAVRSKARLHFRYSGTPRVVHPASLRTQQGRWYLRGNEDGSTVVKRFVVSRMSEVAADAPGTAAPVADTEPESLHPLAWEVDSPVEVTLRAPQQYAADVRRWLGAPVEESEEGADALLVYRVTHRAAMRARIYQLGTRVRVEGPEGFRDELLAELATMAGE
ncbi:WYL domain-containing protein [Nocardioides jiangxiensis]|uniref:WYL domain-containing protein n=1 Tax=Nocardioides jiangxiensis TaxID=3064524 RepID=A0ABT9AZ30_9ACTN|nr:WYL domain-containing protein [Nocardioides sp. WY-20]MDO7867623.1 WYL domain-containing protein [Nocardioides sp. WY-20]